MKKFIEFLTEKGHNQEAFDGLEASEQLKLQNEYNAELKQAFEDAIENKSSKEDLEALKAAVQKSNDSVVKSVEALALAMKANAESNKEGGKMSTGLRKYIEDNSEVLKAIKTNKNLSKGGFDITLKGVEGAADITNRDAYTTVEPGQIKQPVRATRILDLFRRKKVNGEFFKYREELVNTRDAKFVVACATSDHDTKKTWIVRTVELAKIRDIVDACMDMLDDYAWVESELKQLINESIKLKADYELLLGVGTNPTDMLSIETIASVFNPSNPLADFSNSFQDANLEQLVDAMGAQISIFGQENSWMADTVVMNFSDFVKYRNLKDVDGNKLNHTLSDTFATIAGMRVVTSPIVAANTLYVFDSTKGEILDRQSITIKTSYENATNVEHETVTFVGVERLQFHVPIIQRDAFMKCSDIATAIAAIAEPTT